MKVVSPGLPDFDYVRAETIEQVSELLTNDKNSLPLMGGTDVFVQMRDGTISPGLLVDVKHLPGMNSIAADRSGSLRIGAAVNLNTLAANKKVVKSFPLLAEAAHAVGSYQLRSRATMGGNLCNASPAADTAPAALVLEGVLVALGPSGERRIHVQDFFLGPGQNALQKREILKCIEFPQAPMGAVGRYMKLGRNTAGDLAIVGVAVLGHADEGSQSGFRFRMALSSVAPTPIRVPEAEQILTRGAISDEMIGEAAQAARRAAKPIDDVRASASYRLEMVEVYARRALHAVWTTLRDI